MQAPRFDELLDLHPDVQNELPEQSFTEGAAPVLAAAALSRCGVIMLRSALPATILPACCASFEQFARSLGGESDAGSWHAPWRVQHHQHLPAATIVSALLRSWAWPVVEKICGSTDIVVLLGLCTARHMVDKPLVAGAHQDATAVAPELPFALWIPLHAVTPRRNSGLGFITPAPQRVLPTLPHNDVGTEYVLANFHNAWVPSYAPGDLSIHTNLSPHFTTGYGTRTDRYSLEIRAMARDAAPPKYQDPAIHVGRRNGEVTVVGTSCSPGVDAGHFLSLLG
ncbi:MAG: hypothetical protein HYX38_37245 [Rhodospirillales bacterium]|nr:hypothetical protein [Rhodospirillales bacterium]